MKKKVEKGLKSGLKSGGDLSNVEKEVLGMFSQGFLVKQIARQRNTSVQAVYKIRKTLIKQGFLSKLNKVENFKPTFKPVSHPIRLHGMEFNIQLLFKGKRFVANKIMNVDNNTIRLYNNSIEVYSSSSFYADDPQKAMVKALAYFNRLFYRLENDLDVIIMKPRSQNIRLVNSHFAEVNNELAVETERQGRKLRVYTNDDGKLWCLVDRSLSMNEFETLHPSTGKHDMENVKGFFNDLRDHEPVRISDILKVLNVVAEQHKETVAGLNAIVRILRPVDRVDDCGGADYFG